MEMSFAFSGPSVCSLFFQRHSAGILDDLFIKIFYRQQQCNIHRKQHDVGAPPPAPQALKGWHLTGIKLNWQHYPILYTASGLLFLSIVKNKHSHKFQSLAWHHLNIPTRKCRKPGAHPLAKKQQKTSSEDWKRRNVCLAADLRSNRFMTSTLSISGDENFTKSVFICTLKREKYSWA